MDALQVRQTRHAGHCWRSKDELISDVLLWTPTYGRAKAGRPARTYIQQLCDDTGCNPEDLPEAMNDREKWRERVRDIRAGGMTSWWWWLYCKGSKRVTQGLRVRGCWRPNRTEIFWHPLLWPSTLRLSRSPDAQQEALGSTLLGAGFLYCILSATSLVLKLHRGSRGSPRPDVAFPTTSRLPPTPTGLELPLDFCLDCVTPTRSLKSHVWSSSSGNNCHAVHRSLSSCASVYECTMGIFYLVPFHQPISAHAISSHNCH